MRLAIEQASGAKYSSMTVSLVDFCTVPHETILDKDFCSVWYKKPPPNAAGRAPTTPTPRWHAPPRCSGTPATPRARRAARLGRPGNAGELRLGGAALAGDPGARRRAARRPGSDHRRRARPDVRPGAAEAPARTLNSSALGGAPQVPARDAAP